MTVLGDSYMRHPSRYPVPPDPDMLPYVIVNNHDMLIGQFPEREVAFEICRQLNANPNLSDHVFRVEEPEES